MTKNNNNSTNDHYNNSAAADVSDADVDRVLLALGQDFAEAGPLVAFEVDDVDRGGDGGEEDGDEAFGDECEDADFADSDVDFEGAFARFMVAATGKPPAARVSLGDRVHEFRDAASPDEVAQRYGLTRAELKALESCQRPFDPAKDSDRDAAIAAAAEIDVPPLKVLRVLKAMRAHMPSTSLEQPHALLLAARSKPPGNDDDR